MILAKSYAFYDFSSISCFPNPVPTRDEWENSLPRFRGEEWEVPVEHLLDFHDYMHPLQVVHEDVQIRLFCSSLEGISRDWYRSLPNASISSLADFHAAFHVFCKDHFPADLLYPQCCHEFHFLTKNSDIYEKYAVEVNTLHHDQEIIDSPHDNLSDAFDIISNASPNLCCHEEEIVPVENLKREEQSLISASDSVRSAELEEDSLQFSDLQGLSNLQLEHVDHDPGCVDVAAPYVMSSPHLPNLQTKTDFSRHLQEGQQKGPDQPSIGYVSPADFEQPFPADLEQFTHTIEIKEDSQPHYFHLQSEQKLEEVLFCEFDDPIDRYLDSMSSINPKNFLSDENYLYHLFKSLFYMI